MKTDRQLGKKVGITNQTGHGTWEMKTDRQLGKRWAVQLRQEFLGAQDGTNGAEAPQSKI
jgi:hypothetical protein